MRAAELHPNPKAKLAFFGALAAAFLLTLAAWLLAAAPPALAQDGAVIRQGDAVVTGFSGVFRPPASLPADVHPLDRTMIDLDGPSAEVFDLSSLGAGPSGQVADAPSRLKIRAEDVGQVFAVALDSQDKSQPPNAFLAATSLYGLQIVAPGDGSREPRRLLQGEPGASWMPGQFGLKLGGGPGSVWKIDGRTGQVSLFANIEHDGKPNAGPALGGIAIDQRTKQVYVADLETGLIHRLGPDGRDLGTYDHGLIGRKTAGLEQVAYDPSRRMSITSGAFNIEDPDTWGYADKARQVFGLAIQGSVLYYAVSEGPQIWSIGLKEDGSFAGDPRLEIDLAETPNGNAVTDIIFDGPDYLYLTQRGEPLGSYDYSAFATPQQSVVLRFSWNKAESRWESVADEFAVGLGGEQRATEGGIALGYGYDRNGNVNYSQCRQTLWTTGGRLRGGEDIKRVSIGGASIVNGLQGNAKTKVRPGNEPPYDSWFVDYDGEYEDPDAVGHIGSVAVYAPCDGTTVLESTQVLEETVVTTPPALTIEKQCAPGTIGSKIRCTITVRNTGTRLPSEPVTFTDVAQRLTGAKANGPVEISEVAPDGIAWSCSPTPAPDLTCTLAPDALPPGDSRSVDVWIDTSGLILTGTHGFRNCASMRHPDGYGKACDEGGTDILIEKTGPSHCLPGGECEFEITITNDGALPFSGDLLLSDTTFVSGVDAPAPIVSISPPLGCAPEPAAVPFSCVATTALAPGEQHTHTITILMPAPGDYWAHNCFAVTDPSLAGKPDLINDLMLPIGFGLVPPGAPSCAWVEVSPAIAPKKISPVSALPPLPPISPLYEPDDYLPDPDYPVCRDGRPRLANGACVCPLGSRWDVASGWCEHIRPRCYDPERRMPNGRCCPFGTEWDYASYSCRIPSPKCYDPARRTPGGDCCPAGSFWDWGSRRCSTISAPCFDGRPRLANGLCRCPLGARWDPATRSCVRPGYCPDGRPRLAGGFCACPQNTIWNRHLNRCVPGDTGQCADPKRRTSSGGCCPPRMVSSGATCTLPGDGIACPKGTAGRYPSCKPILLPCPAGTFGRYPNCRPPQQTCPAGTIGKYPKCTPVQRPCPTGTVGTYPNCKTVGGVCPRGTVGTFPSCTVPGKTCPTGTVGIFPKCRPVVPTCPAGTFGKPPACKPIAQTCPAGTTGTYPNCVTPGPKCPPGTFGRYPKCTPVTKPCPAGTTGTFPACKPTTRPACPTGTTGTYPNCKAPPATTCPPGTTGKPPACKPIIIKPCPPGSVGVPPKCAPASPGPRPGGPVTAPIPPLKQIPLPRHPKQFPGTKLTPKAPPPVIQPKPVPKIVPKAPHVTPKLAPKAAPKVTPKHQPKVIIPKAAPKAAPCPSGTIGTPPRCIPVQIKKKG